MKKVTSTGNLKRLIAIILSSALTLTTLAKNSNGSNASLWKVGNESMPGNLHAFQENRGQFINFVNDWKVLYGGDAEGTQVLFTPKGVIYYLPQQVKMTEEEIEARDKNGKGEKEDGAEQEAKNYKCVYNKVSVEWENANPNVRIEAIDKTTYTFGCILEEKGTGVDHIPGYKKLIYHDLYPGIDVEYIFSPIKGVKYTIIAKPGANLNVLKMLYKGMDGLSIEQATGNVIIKTPVGNMIDHAPVTMQNGSKVESSFRIINKNEVSIKMGAYNNSQPITIDPWVVSPITTGYYPSDVAMDDSNNVYVLNWDGKIGAGKCIAQKYGTTGSLIWTYSFTQYGSNYSISDMAVDPLTGNSYYSQPYYYSNGGGGSYAMICLTSAGSLSYFNNTNSSDTAFETWNLTWSCQLGKLVEAGAPTVVRQQIGIINAANGKIAGPFYTTRKVAEMYAGTVAPNGYLYGISSNGCFCTTGNSSYTNNLCCYDISGVTAAPLWNKRLPRYDFEDFRQKSPAGMPNNGIAAGCSDIYTSDGAKVYEITTAGAIIDSAVIPHGENVYDSANTGIAVDPVCGYVYVGSRSRVQVFTSSLIPVTTYTCPGIVYDVTYRNGFVSCCGADSLGVGFVAQFTAQTCAAPVTITVGASNCGNSTGTASAKPSFCGTGPYTYLWSPGGQTTSSITGLSAGTYTVTIGLPSACLTIRDSAIVNNSSSPALTTTVTANIKCGGDSTGSGNVTVSGGTLPYTYLWSPGGQITSSITGLTSGTYTVVVKDHNGCMGTDSMTITQPAALGTVIIFLDPSFNCKTGVDDTLLAFALGGTFPYSFSWSNGNTGYKNVALSAGTYSVTLTDGNGCTATASATVTQPPTLTDTISSVNNISCFGNVDGSLSVSATGGTFSYSFSWSNGSTSSTITGLSAGTYSVTVTDGYGCIATATANITQPPVLTEAISPIKNISCFGNTNGSLGVSGSGGTAPYSFSWSNGSSSTNNTGLSVGIYTVTITDNNGCTATASASITQPSALADSVSYTNLNCNGINNGSATANPTGGTPSYTYLWSNGSISQNATGLSAGTYKITVTDNNGCTNSASIIITEPPAMSITKNFSASSATGCNGTAWVTVSGGTPGYTYAWSPGGATTDSIKSVCPGSYCCTVTDNKGCVDSVCITVIVSAVQEIGDNTSTISIFPDPNNGYFTVSGVGKGQVVELYNDIGQKLNRTIASETNMHINIMDKPNGIYLVRILTNDGRLVGQAKLLKVN